MRLIKALLKCDSIGSVRIGYIVKESDIIVTLETKKPKFDQREI